MSLHNFRLSLKNRKCIIRAALVIIAYLMVMLTGCATVDVNENSDGPYIVSTYPSSGDFNISRHTDITIRFSEVMAIETKTGFQMIIRGTKVDGDARWMDSDTLLAFRPYQPLEANSLFQCIIGIGKSKDGKGLRGVPYIWMFSTGN